MCVRVYVVFFCTGEGKGRTLNLHFMSARAWLADVTYQIDWAAAAAALFLCTCVLFLHLFFFRKKLLLGVSRVMVFLFSLQLINLEHFTLLDPLFEWKYANDGIACAGNYYY